MRIACEHCEEGRLIKSRWGGNDPDTWDAGPCEECGGTGEIEVFCDSCNKEATRVTKGFWPKSKTPYTEYTCEACFAETEG